MNDEISNKVVWKSHPAKMSCFKDFVLGVLLLPIVVGVYFLVRAFVHIYSTEYSITAKSVSVKTGLFSTRRSEIRIADIRGVEIERTLWQRLINTGTVAIGTAATSSAEIYIADVSDPQKVVAVIDSIRG